MGDVPARVEAKTISINIKMIFPALVQGVWSRLRRRAPVSMVLLLRKPIFFTNERLSAAVEHAWGSVPTRGDSDHFVTQSEDKSVVYVKPHMISLLNSNKPYFNVNPDEHAKTLPQASQQKAWRDHRAWISLDYIRSGRDIELEYSTLARLAAEMVDENCSGLYVPRERSFIPNDISLRDALEKMGR
jgi:hypothetical protein